MRRTPSRRRLVAVPLGRGKTRITIRLDDDILVWFRAEVHSSGGSYQRAINLALRDYIAREPLEATLRRVVREEVARALGRSFPYAYGEEPQPAALVADAGSQYSAGRKLSRRLRPGRRGRKD